MLELKDRPSILACVQDAPVAAGQWKILLRFKGGRRATMWGEMVFTMSRTKDVQGGSGDMVWSERERVSPPVRTEVEGFIGATAARLQLYMLKRPIGHSPFVCEGEAVTPDLHYSGAWHMECMDPVECGCSGAWGDFTLVKLG